MPRTDADSGRRAAHRRNECRSSRRALEYRRPASRRGRRRKKDRHRRDKDREMDRIAMRVLRLGWNARIATKSRKGAESPITQLAVGDQIMIIAMRLRVARARRTS